MLVWNIASELGGPARVNLTDVEECMKKLAYWTIISMFAFSLMACASTMGGEKVHLKCPSCGYEFDVDTAGEN